MLQGSESPATLSVSPSFHLFLLFLLLHLSRLFLKQKVFFGARRAAEAVRADRHNTRTQTICGNPGALSSSQFSVFYLNCLFKKKKKEILQKSHF